MLKCGEDGERGVGSGEWGVSDCGLRISDCGFSGCGLLEGEVTIAIPFLSDFALPEAGMSKF
jgi:hypothetical protein